MSLDAILKQYEKNTTNAPKKMTSEERLKQYFTTFLPDKVQSAVRRVRVLPVGENESPFVEVMGHKAQVDGKWRTFVCPKHEKDENCPFCEAREALLATGEEGDEELAKKYGARRMYVVKVIDRDNEDEGPKFWRFNHDYRKTGILDKIVGVVKAIAKSSAPDITDIKNGRDLVITINRDQNNRPTVSSIVQSDPSPLHENEDIVKEWLSDERTWEDVYTVKPYEYLEIIVKGGEPAWDKENEAWVDKNSLSDDADVESYNDDDELTVGGSDDSDDADELPTKNSKKVEASSDEDDEDDDLPF